MRFCVYSADTRVAPSPSLEHCLKLIIYSSRRSFWPETSMIEAMMWKKKIHGHERYLNSMPLLLVRASQLQPWRLDHCPRLRMIIKMEIKSFSRSERVGAANNSIEIILQRRVTVDNEEQCLSPQY